MRRISTEGWVVDEYNWSIAPAGLDWIKEGSLFQCGPSVSIGQTVHIGDRVLLRGHNEFGDYTVIDSYAAIGFYVTADRNFEVEEHASIGSNSKFGKFNKIGRFSKIGADCTFDDHTRLGYGSKIGEGASDPLYIGNVGTTNLTTAQVKGVAYVGINALWLTLGGALERFEEREGYETVMCLLQSAVAVANKRGWKHG